MLVRNSNAIFIKKRMKVTQGWTSLSLLPWNFQFENSKEFTLNEWMNQSCCSSVSCCLIEGEWMNIWSEKSQVKFAWTTIDKDELFNFSMKKGNFKLKLLDRAKIWPFWRNFPPKWPNFAIQNVVECPVQRKFVLFEAPKNYLAKLCQGLGFNISHGAQACHRWATIVVKQQQLWSRLSSNQGIAIWLHITRIFPIELSIPRLARDECRDWRFMSLRSLVSVEVFEVDSILTNLHRGTKSYETPSLHCRHCWSSRQRHHGRSSVHRPAASAPLPDSSSFFQQRPISVYNTPVQDCLWDAGLLMSSFRYGFVVLHIKVDATSRNKKLS